MRFTTVESRKLPRLCRRQGNHLGWFRRADSRSGRARDRADGALRLQSAFEATGFPRRSNPILINGSKVRPRLAVLKPLFVRDLDRLQGGPFGAEGPIMHDRRSDRIDHCAAFPSDRRLERKTLLVAGRGGEAMAATFATPIAAVLLAVELLLFEWKPRSAIPVALASATAGAARRYILEARPAIPPFLQHAIFIGPQGLAGCVVAEPAGRDTFVHAYTWRIVYAAEDAFKKLPIHWMWWPAIGGVFVGLGGMLFPEALGVGYDTIRSLLQGDVPRTMIAGVLLVKSAIWIISLGSGEHIRRSARPFADDGERLWAGLKPCSFHMKERASWPLVSGMGAILGGTMRAPFTAIWFAQAELTHDINVLLPLLVAAMLAHATTVLLLKRSLLTEKVARRGFHITRQSMRPEVRSDPVCARSHAQWTKVAALPAGCRLSRMLRHTVFREPVQRGQHLFTRGGFRKTGQRRHNPQAIARSGAIGRAGGFTGRDSPRPCRYPPGRAIASGRLSHGGDRAHRGCPLSRVTAESWWSMVSLEDLLLARVRNLTEERHRETASRITLSIPQPGG